MFCFNHRGHTPEPPPLMAAHLPSVAGVLSGAGVLLLSLDVRDVPAVSDVAVNSAVADILAAVGVTGVLAVDCASDLASFPAVAGFLNFASFPAVAGDPPYAGILAIAGVPTVAGALLFLVTTLVSQRPNPKKNMVCGSLSRGRP
jgi:hypothetical protein